MKKIIIFAACALSISSVAYASRVPMWRMLFEQEDISHYYDVGTLVNTSNGWNYKYKAQKRGFYTATKLCKQSENGVWSREINIQHCSDEDCSKVKDTDWEEFKNNQVGYALCIAVLPYCDEDRKNKYGFCRNRVDE